MVKWPSLEKNRARAGHQCGLYKQVVWRNSSELGCGQAMCPKEAASQSRQTEQHRRRERSIKSRRREESLFFFLFSLFFMSSSLFWYSHAANSISQGQFVGSAETLISSSGIFELGFFSPVNSSLRYVGIWHHNISVKTVVWVANRENPVSDEYGVLTVSSDGNLMVLDGDNRTVWSSGINSSSVPTNSTAVLMDSGNLVLLSSGDADSARANGDISSSYWQSFVHPTDMYLPGMRVSDISNSYVQPAKECNVYNKCGYFAICDEMDSPVCSCMQGFSPKSPHQWNRGNWSTGCARKTPLQCRDNSSIARDHNDRDGFLKFDSMKLPDSAYRVSAKSNEECEEKCLQNCSCVAFAFDQDIECMLWSNILTDVQHFSNDGLSLYIRLANSELGKKSKVIITVLVGAFVLGVAGWLLWRYKDNLKDGLARDAKEVGGADIPVFKFSSIEAATNVFAEENKLGLGGFGPVYKGELPGGQEIAVKRLSRKSSQGVEEFKNEVTVIAKLQHRNLVRLLGFCAQGEDKMLIYEYMPNRSLDYFIFDPVKRAQLNWKKRLEIIEGIARGLLYLHRDSRLRIIHRDLKASNILLDEAMNPKISDFGTARIFSGNENKARTKRAVGTYGYMSPEYAMEGIFSFKSDVYSFGVLLLEIICGEKNIEFRTSEHNNLIGHAWHHWNEGKAIELIDPCIRDTCLVDEVLRCIQIGLLCVQESPEDRLAMPSIVLHLESETPAGLPLPKPPMSLLIRGFIDPCSSGTAGLPFPELLGLTSITGSTDTYYSSESYEWSRAMA